MGDKIAVAYASKYGATREIAEKIGEALRGAGFETEVLPVKEVKDLTQYMAIVLGSAIYIGQWRKEASAFVKSHKNDLAKMPVWIFSSGPTGEGDAEALIQGWRFPGDLGEAIDHIGPRDTVVFHGVIDFDKFNFLEKMALKKVCAPLGDWRNWDLIGKWAQGIAKELKKKD